MPKQIKETCHFCCRSFVSLHMHLQKDPNCGPAYRRAKEASNLPEPLEEDSNDAQCVDVGFTNADRSCSSSSAPPSSSSSSSSGSSAPDNKEYSLKPKGFHNIQKQTQRSLIYKPEWKQYCDSDQSSSRPSLMDRKVPAENTDPPISSNVIKNNSLSVPPVIEFDDYSFRNAPQPVLMHDGPYGGALKIGPPGRDRNMFPDHNIGPHPNPKAPPRIT